MAILKIHKQALDDKRYVFHEFLTRYRKRKKCIYGFVEGNEDPSFYRGAIENLIPQDWEVELWSAGGKDKVVDIYRDFDWNRYPRTGILFFLDQDLSIFLSEILPNANNIYITRTYSIENEIVSRGTCNRVLNEICNLSSIPKGEMEKILDLFEIQLNLFKKRLIPIMVWIIIWKRKGLKPHLNDIYMKHLFQVVKGKLKAKPRPKGCKSFKEYIHKQCNIPIESKRGIKKIEREFCNSKGKAHFIRGKYVLWFLVEFALSIHQNIVSMSALKKKPKMRAQLSQSNAIILVGPRARVPENLKRFLNRTCCVYVKEWPF